MELLLATGNPHKKEELERILRPHAVLTPAEITVDFYADETGDTYLENALIKARALAIQAGHRPVIADDSGLSVPALGGAPGVHSARFGSQEAGRELESWEKNDLLLRKMDHLTGDQRRAFFVCCMVLLVEEYRIFTVQEIFPGLIATKPAGDGGFGYDPVFHLPDRGRSLAQLEAEEKDEISHRGRAGIRIKSILDNLEAAP